MLSFIKTKWYSYKFDNATGRFGRDFYLLLYKLNEVRRESRRDEKSHAFDSNVQDLRRKIQGFIDLKEAFLDYLMYGARGSYDLDNAIRFLVAYASITQGKNFVPPRKDFLYEKDIDIDYLIITKDAQRIFKGALSSPNLFQLTEYPKILSLENELAQSFNRIVKDSNLLYTGLFKETSA